MPYSPSGSNRKSRIRVRRRRPNIIRMIESRKMKDAGHVERMETRKKRLQNFK
jgi:hypothetical protein